MDLLLQPKQSPFVTFTRVPRVSCSTLTCLWAKRWQPSAPSPDGWTWCVRTLTTPSYTWATTTARSPCGRPTRKKLLSRCCVTRAASARWRLTRRASELASQHWYCTHFNNHNLHCESQFYSFSCQQSKEEHVETCFMASSRLYFYL